MSLNKEAIYYRLLFDRCKRDLGYFVFSFCHTKDEHDPGNPIKLMPRKKYLETIIDCYLKEDILFIEKSRQIMCTWIFACIALHRAVFYPFQKILVISKKEPDALDFVEKIKHLYEHLPKWLQLLAPLNVILHNQAKGQFELANKSVIIGLPSGSHQIRSHTGSVVMIDEAAFQADFNETYATCVPAVLGGGKLIAFSSAYPGAFQTAVEASGECFPKGLTSRTTSNNIRVLTIHYSADLDKNPDTEKGKIYVAKIASTYLGGWNDPLCQREMEGNYAAGGGDFVFLPEIFEMEHGIVMPASVMTPGLLRSCTLFGGFDWGQRNPTACIIFALSPSKIIYAIWEYYVQGLDPIQVATDIVKSPYYKDVEYIAGDPDLWRSKQISSSRQGFTNVAAILSQEMPENIRLKKLIPGEGCKDSVFIDKLRIMWGKDIKQFVVLDSCYNFITELKNLRHPKVSYKQNNIEGIIDKDNHLFDSAKYGLMTHPSVRVITETAQRGTFAYYEEVDAKARELVESSDSASYSDIFLDIFEG